MISGPTGRVRARTLFVVCHVGMLLTRDYPGQCPPGFAPVAASLAMLAVGSGNCRQHWRTRGGRSQVGPRARTGQAQACGDTSEPRIRVSTRAEGKTGVCCVRESGCCKWQSPPVVVVAQGITSTRSRGSWVRASFIQTLRAARPAWRVNCSLLGRVVHTRSKPSTSPAPAHVHGSERSRSRKGDGTAGCDLSGARETGHQFVRTQRERGREKSVE